MKKYTVDVIIPTYRPDQKFHKLIAMLGQQTYAAGRILIMNTEEALFPADFVNLPGTEVRHLKKAEFDHGGTRDRAAALSDADLLLFMTQDAVPADRYLIERLVAAFDDDEVKAAYARQLADSDCKIIEKYTRSFNYPAEGSVKSRADLPQYGIKTFFCSNVCAMYRKDFYDRLGGFDHGVIFNEDMIFAGKIILNGGKIAYAANARVVHSHNYNMSQQLHRNFDLAVSQADHPEIFELAKSEQEGMRLVKKTAAYLVRIRKPWLVFSLVASSGFKLIGYRLGKIYKRLPRRLVLALTMNKSYWN